MPRPQPPRADPGPAPGAPRPEPPAGHRLRAAAEALWRALGADAPADWSAGDGHLCRFDPASGARVELREGPTGISVAWLAVDPEGRLAPRAGGGSPAEAARDLAAFAAQAAAAPAAPLGADRFFQLAEAAAAAGLRLELIQGRLVGRAGASVEHEAIVASAIAAIKPRLRAAGGRVIGSNLYLQAGEDRTLPDLSVFCGPSARGPSSAAPDRPARPALLVEVSSPSTVDRDTREKVAAYLGLPGLRVYLVVHSDRRLVEVWRPGAASPERITHGAVPLHDEGLFVDIDDLYDQTEL